MHEAEPFDRLVLHAVVEGFRARAGTKERFQALSEYEVARRAGIVDCSYVAYEETLERQRVRASLARLQRDGQVRSHAVSGRYETFVPVQAETRAQEPDDAPCGPVAPPSEALRPQEAALPDTFEGRLDEIIRLLRSIDARLARIERG